MAFIRRIAKATGEITFWVHDIRDGRYIRIAECETQQEAELHKEQYEIRHSLEKEGYFDIVQDQLDRMSSRPNDLCQDCRRTFPLKDLLYLGSLRACKYCLRDKHGISESLFNTAKGDD